MILLCLVVTKTRDLTSLIIFFIFVSSTHASRDRVSLEHKKEGMVKGKPDFLNYSFFN